MKIESLFEKYQKIIKPFANTKFGKSYLGIPWDEKVDYLDVGSWHTFLDKKNVKGTFYSGDPYIYKLYKPLFLMELIEQNVCFNFNKLKEKLDYVIPYYLNFCNVSFLPKILLTESTINPDADPETTTTDGNVQRTGTDLTWADIRDGVGTSASDTSVTIDSPELTSSAATANRWDAMKRAITLFKTDLIGPSGSVSAATYGLYVSNISDAFGQNARMVTSNPASNTALVSADYTTLGTATQATGDLDLSTLSNNAYNTWTLTSTGIGNISKVGVTKFGVRLSGDADNSA